MYNLGLGSISLYDLFPRGAGVSEGGAMIPPALPFGYGPDQIDPGVVPDADPAPMSMPLIMEAQRHQQQRASAQADPVPDTYGVDYGGPADATPATAAPAPVEERDTSTPPTWQEKLMEGIKKGGLKGLGAMAGGSQGGGLAPPPVSLQSPLGPMQGIDPKFLLPLMQLMKRGQ